MEVESVELKMSGYLQELGKLMTDLDQVIQPYKWSNSSAQKIQATFKEMNLVVSQAEKHMITYWMYMQEKLGKAFDNYLLTHGISNTQIQHAVKSVVMRPTRLKFKVPMEGRANKGMWEACSCYYIDKLTQAAVDMDREAYEAAILDLIDIGRAYDREMDADHDPYAEMSDDENRAKRLYGDIYDDGFDRKAGDPTPPSPKEATEMLTKYHGTPEKINDFWQEVIHGSAKEVAEESIVPEPWEEWRNREG